MQTWTADGLFERYFWPHYPADVRQDPALRDRDANPAGNPAIAAHLAEAAEIFVANAPALLEIQPGWDESGVVQVARALDRERRDRLLAASNPDDPSNVFFNTVVHATAYVGEVARRAFGCTWSLRRPMWESLVVRTSPEAALPIFHWWLKHLADDEIAHASLAHRFHVHVAMPLVDIDSLAVLAPPRALPTLRAPRYDQLVAYLQKHLPALRDLGTGFPSPGEFSDTAFTSLGFALFHGGRVLAIYGQAPPRDPLPSRVVVHWITANGFDHADTIPCEATPPAFVRPTGDALEITVVWQGRPHTHRVHMRGHA